MKRKEIVKKIDKQIKELEDIKNDTYKKLEEERKLPDDPSIGIDVFGDGILNQNPELKATYLQNRQHTIGYCEGAIVELKSMKYYLTVTDKQYKKDQKKDAKIKKANKKTMEKLKVTLMKHVKKEKD